MEKYSESQEDFSMRYSSLALGSIYLSRCYRWKLWGLIVTGSAFEVQNRNKMKIDN